jgi:hypothetical protein
MLMADDYSKIKHCHTAQKWFIISKHISTIYYYYGWVSSPQHGTSSSCGWRNGLQLWKVAANTL